MDESVTIEFMEWAVPVLEVLKRGRLPHENLWPFSLAELATEFRLSVEQVGLAELQPTLYAIRHGGASEDFLRRRRSFDEIQRRGRWRTTTSVRRYTKEAKVLSELHKVSAMVLSYGEFVEPQLQQLFLNPSTVPTFPVWSRAQRQGRQMQM